MKKDEVARTMLKERHVANAKYTFRKKVKHNDDMEKYTFISNSASASRTQEVDVPAKRLMQRSSFLSRSQQEASEAMSGKMLQEMVPDTTVDSQCDSPAARCLETVNRISPASKSSGAIQPSRRQSRWRHSQPNVQALMSLLILPGAGHHTGGSRLKHTVHPCPLRWGGCGLLAKSRKIHFTHFFFQKKKNCSFYFFTIFLLFPFFLLFFFFFLRFLFPFASL